MGKYSDQKEISSVLAPFENFAEIIFLFFDFKGFSEFSIKILPNFLYMSLFSQLHRAFFLCFANRLIISDSLKNKRTRKAFIMIRPI